MQDSWQGQTSRLSSSAAHTLLQPPLRFCCLLLLTAPISLPFFLPVSVSFSFSFSLFLSLSYALAKNHRICAHEETWERIRGRGRLRRLSWWGLYAGRQVDKRDMWQPVLPLRLAGCVQAPKPVQENATRRSRVVRVAGASRRSAEAPDSSTLHKLHHYV